MGVGHAALVLGALGVALSAQAGQPIHVSPKPKLHALYTLRGGVQPAMAERVRPTTPSGSRSASSLQRSIKALPNKVKGKKKKEPTASVTLDVVGISQRFFWLRALQRAISRGMYVRMLGVLRSCSTLVTAVIGPCR